MVEVNMMLTTGTISAKFTAVVPKEAIDTYRYAYHLLWGATAMLS